MKTLCHTQKWNYIVYCNAISGELRPDYRQHAWRNLVKYGCVVFNLCKWTDKQTNEQTYLPQYFATLPGLSKKTYARWCRSFSTSSSSDNSGRTDSASFSSSLAITATHRNHSLCIWLPVNVILNSSNVSWQQQKLQPPHNTSMHCLTVQMYNL